MHANNFLFVPQRIQGKNKKKKKIKNKYFASIGLIGIPGIIDIVDDENPRPLFIREGTIKSCQSQCRNIHIRKLLLVKQKISSYLKYVYHEDTVALKKGYSIHQCTYSPDNFKKTELLQQWILYSRTLSLHAWTTQLTRYKWTLNGKPKKVIHNEKPEKLKDSECGNKIDCRVSKIRTMLQYHYHVNLQILLKT